MWPGRAADGHIVPLGFVTLGATFVWTRLSVVLAKALSFCTGLLLAIVEWFTRWPRLTYRIPGPPPLWLVVAFFAAFIALAAVALAGETEPLGCSRFMRFSFRNGLRLSYWRRSRCWLRPILLLHVWRGDFEVAVLDVGQGDSIFVASPDERTMLVDGGGLAGSEWFKTHGIGAGHR